MSKAVAIKPEILETPDLELTIETTLKKNNVTDEVINAMKEKYGGLKLSSLEDKENYLIIKESRKEVRKIGIIAEKICEEGRSEAVKIQRLWLEKQKAVLKKIAEVQDPLDAEIKKYEDEVARKEKEEQERKEREYMARQTTLLKMEAKYEDDCFVLGGVSYEVNNIREADKEIWEETILPKYQREFVKIETAKAQEEHEKKLAAEKLRQEQEEFEKKQKEFEEKQKQFELQQAELQRKQDEANRKENERIAEENRIKQEAANKRWRDRLAVLDEIGWNGQFAFPRLGDSETKVFTYDELVELSDETFNERAKEYNASTSAIKKLIAEAAEAKRLADIEEAKQIAIKQEQERIAEEKRLADIKAKQEEERRQEELAKASDKEKWALYVEQLSAVKLPVFTSNIYKGKANVAKEKIEEIQAL